MFNSSTTNRKHTRASLQLHAYTQQNESFSTNNRKHTQRNVPCQLGRLWWGRQHMVFPSCFVIRSHVCLIVPWVVIPRWFDDITCMSMSLSVCTHLHAHRCLHVCNDILCYVIYTVVVWYCFAGINAKLQYTHALHAYAHVYLHPTTHRHTDR